MLLQDHFKTAEKLQDAIDNYQDIEGMEDYLDASFANTIFDLDYGSAPTFEEALNGEWFPLPYWACEGSVDYYLDGRKEYDTEELFCEYVNGIYEPLNYGDITTYKNEKYEYFVSLPLPQEMEHQANDGNFAYEYRGESFLRVWKKISDMKEHDPEYE